MFVVCFFPKAIHMETDPQTISAYLIYLSQHAPVGEQSQHNDLALVRFHFKIRSLVFTHCLEMHIMRVFVYIYM